MQKNRRIPAPNPCAVCRKSFLATKDKLRKGHGTFCSRSCAARSPKQKKQRPELWDRELIATAIQKHGTIKAVAQEIGCAHRTVAHIMESFGITNPWVEVNRTTTRDVSKAAWLIHQGCTLRETASYIGVHESTISGWMKSRNIPVRVMYGETHHKAKLTTVQVQEIRKRHSKGDSIARLARVYHVRPRTISNIVHRKNWKHVI